ncbi:MAG TPA: TadE/TadG family type IV pilus assembly protein [Candidatus Dormibacteraeota bacterium]|nr:TadE/TadG family type IV pilus assembly protein [Candidatus Dormibacteraeota bacterium]
MRRARAGTALVEFALAWPAALLLALGCVEFSVWSAEALAVRSAALAGARAASVAGGGEIVASQVTLRALEASLVGTTAAAWCPGQADAPPAVWVCARDAGLTMEVTIGGTAPAIVPLVAGAGLPLHAHVAVRKEIFS